MKKGFLFFFLLLSNILYGQMITTPATQSIEASTTVNVNDFVVNWGNNTESLLISLSLEYQSTATFNLPTTTGLTRNYGYNSWTGINTLVFYGTRDNVNAALAAMTITMGSVKTAVKINVEVSPFDVSYVYNPVNKHYYKYVASSQITYTNARAGASSNSFLGKTGYLVTITSQSEQDFVNNNIVGSNIWIALSDAATTTDGTWMLDAGPESGTIIKTQNGPTAGNIDGQYNNWCTGEPNGANHSEDYAVAKWNGGTCWNDLSNTNTGSVAGYIVEISDDFPAGSSYTGVYTAYVVHNNVNSYSLSTGTGLSSATISNYPNVFGGLQMNDSHTLTVPSGSTFNSNSITLNGTGKVVFTDATSKWMPGTPNVNNTFIHSPSTNSNPSYWSVSSVWNYEAFSSSAASTYTPYLNSQQGWSVLTNDANQWIILNYDVPAYITGIVTQGRAFNFGQYVTAANVDVSLDGTTWTRALTGVSLNTNSTDAVTAYFPTVVYAKFVKVMPLATSYVGHMTMRLGLIIKSNNIVPDGLVLHLDAGNLTSYMGTGTLWNDLSGKGMNGTLGNSPTYNLTNKGNFTFNGSTTQVSIPDHANLEPGTGDWTMEAWINSSNISANTVILGKINNGGLASSVSYMMRSNSAGLFAQMGDGTGAFVNSTSFVIAANKWYHVVYVWKAGGTKTLETFINGKSVGSVSHTMSSLLNSTNPLYIGRYNGGEYAQSFTGNIGIVRLYKKALNLTEIGINFNANRDRYGL